jgi:membrane-associated phospholipid phosphatase
MDAVARCRQIIPNPANHSFLAWPGWALLAQTLLLALPVTLWWVLIYHGANWLTEMRSYRVRVHLDAELAMPFVPPFILAYVSMDLVFVPAPFILRSRRELEALALSLAVVTAVAGISFLLWPAELAYPRRDPGAWSAIFAFARQIALPYNLVPSLHVAMSCIGLAAYATHCGTVGKALLGTWAAAIALSALLTHQHHLLDVVTGLILAVVGKRFIYDYWRRHPPDLQRPPASPCGGPRPSA